jgi:hypothetical protein
MLLPECHAGAGSVSDSRGPDMRDGAHLRAARLDHRTDKAVRVAMGLIFVTAGWGKVASGFGTVAGNFAKMGMPGPQDG